MRSRVFIRLGHFSVIHSGRLNNPTESLKCCALSKKSTKFSREPHSSDFRQVVSSACFFLLSKTKFHKIGNGSKSSSISHVATSNCLCHFRTTHNLKTQKTDLKFRPKLEQGFQKTKKNLLLQPLSFRIFALAQRAGTIFSRTRTQYLIRAVVVLFVHFCLNFIHKDT